MSRFFGPTFFRGITSICLCGIFVHALGLTALSRGSDDSAVRFVNVAKAVGITARTIYGDEHKNRYLLETTGCGAAFLDYDNDGRLDVFLVNGTRLDNTAVNPAPTNRLYRQNPDGTFTDVTE